MYQLIELEAFSGNKYTVELIQLNANNSVKVTAKIYFNVTENQLTLLTTVSGTLNTVKKAAKNYLAKKGKMIDMTIY